MPASADGASPEPQAIDRAVWVRVGVIVAAMVLGLVLNHFVQRHLAALQVLAETDAIAARARLATEIRIGGLGLFALTGLLGVSLIATARRGARELRFPPTGLWGWGATRIVTGPAARRLAVVGVILGTLLIACSLAGAAVSWRMGTVLLACRAGLPPQALQP
jgi:hypothetical protein